ncbi:unnamed protein product [Paramecium pentaurelia]|uniref:Protein kinase domain-containing protein n=1 Tax=Paramecium pentaurelia TaxID=43138 RepID=A0A8S1U1S6_9CILI|nr:unnamed protein product [Paramecium pentaurelia]
MLIKVEQIEVKKGDLIGTGGNGQVFQGQRSDGSFVAIKQQMTISDHEQKILQAIRKKNKDGIFTIMELAKSLDLRQIQDKRKACLQMAKGVFELEQLGFFHRDLKPDNFVMGEDGKIKLIDFGTTKQNQKQTNTAATGTYLYMAPEMIISTNYDSSVDIWSLGVIFYEVFTNETFFLICDTSFKLQLAITQITQFQINQKLRKKQINYQLNELLQKMIVQYLDGEQKIIILKKRIRIDEVINELEKQIEVEQTQQQIKILEYKEDLSKILTSSNYIDECILNVIIEILRKAKISDCLKFLSQNKSQTLIKQYILQIKNNITLDKQQIIGDLDEKIQKITNLLKQIKVHDFNKISYSIENQEKTKQDLLNKISHNEKIIKLLKFLIRLTAFDNLFIYSGSNSLHLLVDMKVDIRNQSFENIRIKNTSVIGGNFVRCNFSGSDFDNVDISGLNLNGAQLFNCKWKNIKVHELNKLDGHSSSVRSVGNTLASGSSDQSILIWDVKTGQQKAELDGHSNDVNSVCFSPDGNTLASGSVDKSIRLWDVKTGQQRAELDGHLSYVYSVCFSPDGNTLASGSVDMSIRLWDVKTGQQRAELDGHSNRVWSVCFSPDGNTLASGSGDNSIRIWDVKTGQQKAELDGHSGTVVSVCFSPVGNTLASGSIDNSIRLWDVKTGQQKAELDGHSNDVNSVCFSPDGNTLASGSSDQSIRLWDVKTGQQKAKLDGHTSYVYSVCFSPDGNTLASGSVDKSIRLWDVKTGQEIKSSDKNYKDILAKFKAPLFQNNPLPVSNYPILVISQELILEAQDTLILQGEFMNHQGKDLKPLFKFKGSCFLEDLKQKQK